MILSHLMYDAQFSCSDFKSRVVYSSLNLLLLKMIKSNLCMWAFKHAPGLMSVISNFIACIKHDGKQDESGGDIQQQTTFHLKIKVPKRGCYSDATEEEEILSVKKIQII